MMEFFLVGYFELCLGLHMKFHLGGWTVFNLMIV